MASSKPPEVQMVRGREGTEWTLALSLRTLAEFRVPNVCNAFHVSLGKSNKFWVSDTVDSLVQTNPEGAVLNRIRTSGGEGYHTVTDDENLIYADRMMNVINKITDDKIKNSLKQETGNHSAFTPSVSKGTSWLE